MKAFPAFKMPVFSRVRQRGIWSAALVASLFVLCFVPQGAAQTPAVGTGGACAACHPDQTDQFGLSVHGRLATFELRGKVRGCEACHGPGDKHVASGEAKDIIGLKSSPFAVVEQTCLGCHADRVTSHWRQSEHANSEVSCVRCHKMHQANPPVAPEHGLLEKSLPGKIPAQGPPPKASLAKPEAVLCAECHKDVVSKMRFPSRHPVLEGKLTCSSCHNVHGSEVASLKTSERANDLCLTCHTSKQGPFVFDHAPVSESCMTCHVPHGSVSNNLLKQNEPFLCLQCHEAHFHIARSGVSTPVINPTGGSQNPWGESGWRRAFGTKCTQCHVAVHGSDLPGQSIMGRGKTLIRR